MLTDSDIVEETAYVVLDLGQEVNAETLRKEVLEHNGISLIGMDSPKPVLRIGNWVFQGEPDIVIGTDLLFKVAAAPQSELVSSSDQSPQSSTDQWKRETPTKAPKIHHIGEVRRIVKFNRVELKRSHQ
ncbi:hypothetical protein BATDEDRAFT_87276 [Batrachochytrium dendrobatidis JAM81]|uniref:Transcription factor TFIIIC triple barrel domain-containing protein n=1 Tax=Batrachochytrium dendrobatidis (strain JAM81 / FGSC 10211) TaxID=684364 RepID=F4NZA5_BATDJ|nr:uncharacterized protein BATDEDRAFT_87276 [Batrachochytrium dendrobatidis JAM81]EGF81859.1 hypothetical protein BATDEDRAFT_87276 [Batrachochytrium dendrobatidis JAM81]KAJ8324600.1 General transcription factor 3C polypeptide 6 [Batrachochytrium dendrobatidis]KAK5670849.1 General transcription factor 3C polypeptide 6 [Batrachochytrium dendrobatidis]|eukprot:XP_006677555.1 hypothetical protein BATDEDRAFT_87276 [Batrachochytrium dendrobatidis JAM81]